MRVEGVGGGLKCHCTIGKCFFVPHHTTPPLPSPTREIHLVGVLASVVSKTFYWTLGLQVIVLLGI